MSPNKMRILLLSVSFYTVGYCQANITDSLDCKRESLDGYFFQNDQFCDKLEEFIQALDLEPTTNAIEAPLIIISNLYCQKDSSYTVSVDIKHLDFISVAMEVNSNYVFIYGGKIQGRFIFLKEKSIYGKMVRSEFNFIDKLNEIDPSLAIFYSQKYKYGRDEGCYTVMCEPFMSIEMNNKGEIIDTKYHYYDAFDLCTFDLIEDFINRYKKK